MAKPVYQTEGGPNALEVMCVVTDSGGSPPDANFVEGGRVKMYDGEPVAPMLVEPTWITTASEPGTSVNVAAIDTVVMAANPVRQFAIITNISDTTIYLRLAATLSVVGTGIPLVPWGSLSIGPSFPYCGAICGIHAGVGNKALAIVEG